jgi:hypothetical protein
VTVIDGVPTLFGPAPESWLVGSIRLGEECTPDEVERYYIRNPRHGLSLIAASVDAVQHVLAFGSSRAGKTERLAAWEAAQWRVCERIASGFRARVCLDVLLVVRGER